MEILSPQWMLLAGIVLSVLISNEKLQNGSKKWGSKLLQWSVILLGASLNFNSVLKQGADGLVITFVSIVSVYLIGMTLAKFLKIEKIQSILITMGTAICGGSAIGAIAPVIRADTLAITISIGVVFLLNGISVFIFPPLGEFLGLSQKQFGQWAALAIHDTSSVVAASSIYGAKALEVGTTIKLTRALWIIPASLLFAFKFKNESKQKITIPWFIFGFLSLSLLFTFIDFPIEIKNLLTRSSKLGFSLTLFLIGYSFNLKKVKEVGSKPFVFGVLLWIIVSVLSLILVKSF